MPLTKRRQFATLLAYLEGQPSIRGYDAYTRDDFDAHIFQIFDWLRRGEQPAQGQDDNDYRREIFEELLPIFNEERQHRILRDLEAVLLQRQGVLSLEDIAHDLRPITWLWPGWLPIGMITLLAARPGTGKSLLALDIAARVIQGDTWPDGAPIGSPIGAAGNVIWVEGENNPSALNERALAQGIDRDHIYPLLPTEQEPIIDLSDPLAYISDSVPQESWQDRLVSMTRRLAPRLIVIDSLGSITRRGENAIEEVRDLMGYLNGLAVSYEVPILLIHHLRKLGGQLALLDDGAMDMDMVRGSGHLAAMARVIWGLSAVQTGPDPDPNGPRKLQVIKTNVAAAPPALGMTLEPILVGDHDEPTGVRIEWSKNPPKPFQEPTKRDNAADWLIEYLEDAGVAVSPKEVIAAAKDADFSRATIYRAYDELLKSGAIINTGGRKNSNACWSLPSNETDPAES